MAELIVGVNSYMTLEEVNSLVNGIYVSTDDCKVWWDGLNDSDKGVVVSRATSYINDDDQMGWIGERVDNSQNLSFPRVLNNNDTINFDTNMKMGLIELMMYLNSNKMSETASMISQGIDSFSDGGGMSVKFNANAKDVITSGFNSYSSIMKRYFEKYSMYIW